jgi:hypothetical protein
MSKKVLALRPRLRENQSVTKKTWRYSCPCWKRIDNAND